MPVQLEQPVRQVVTVSTPSGIQLQITQPQPKVITVAVPGMRGPAGGALPAGGLAGQALVKASDAPEDYQWGFPSPIDGGTFN